MRKEIDEARKLGYEVNEAMSGTLHVSGFGLSTYYTENNDEAWESLVTGHTERKRQFEMTDEEYEAELEKQREKG